MRRSLPALFAFCLTAAAASAQSTTTAFTYQGFLKENGLPVNGQTDIEFRLFSTATGPSLVGSAILTNVPVQDGVFTARLNDIGQFGSSAFNGSRRWLDIRVNGQSFPQRQEILPVPYAHWALGPWRTIGSNLSYDNRVGLGVGENTPTARLEILDGTNLPAAIDETVYSPLKIISPVLTQALLFDSNQIESAGSALFLNARQQNGIGNNIILGLGGGNVGVGTGSPEQRLHVAGNGLFTGDLVVNGDVYGNGSLLLGGSPSISPQLILTNTGTTGFNTAFANVTVNIRPTPVHTSVFQVENAIGTNLFSVSATGVTAVNGVLSVSGTKNFIIDHPEDPTGKFLLHNAVEGPGYYTHYQGNAVLDADGAAWVTLPDYFDSLNTEPTYHLTCIGGHAPVYIADEVRGNRFRIAGGKPGMKVSWTINAVRKDPYAVDHPYQAVQEKQGSDRGTRLYTPASAN